VSTPAGGTSRAARRVARRSRSAARTATFCDDDGRHHQYLNVGGLLFDHGSDVLAIRVSDASQSSSLREFLRHVPGISVEQLPGAPEAYEQGALDELLLAATSGGALTVALQMLPDFLRSRRSELTLTVKARGKEIRLDAKNVDDVLPIIDKIIDA
jgi:hypothetical protein